MNQRLEIDSLCGAHLTSFLQGSLYHHVKLSSTTNAGGAMEKWITNPEIVSPVREPDRIQRK